MDFRIGSGLNLNLEFEWKVAWYIIPFCLQLENPTAEKLPVMVYWHG
jgi:hypothetical protein